MLTQIHDISYVQFYVGDSQAKYKDGSYIGLMTKDSFVDDTNESLEILNGEKWICIILIKWEISL